MAASPSASSAGAPKAQSVPASSDGEQPAPRSPRGPREAAWPHHTVLLLFTLLWGSNFVLAEVAVAEMAPIAFSVSRFVMGGVGLLALLYGECWWRARTTGTAFVLFPRLRRADWPRLVLVAVLGALLAPWLGIEGLHLTSAGRAAFWLALAPVLSALLGTMLRTEHLSGLGRLGLAIACVGALGLAYDGFAPGRSYWAGDLLLFAALLMAVAELHLIKPLAARYGATPMVAARTVIGGMLYVLVASPALAQQPWLALSGWTWVAILAGGIVGVGIGQWVKVRALRVIGPTQVVIYGNLVPLATLGIAAVTIGTSSSPLEIGAGVLIVVGAACLQLGGRALRVAEAEAESPTMA